MNKIDKSIINNINKVNVLRTLWCEKAIFKAEIARLTNLSLPTVMKIVDEFEKKDLINVTGKGVSSGGKPPMMLELNKHAYYVIGVDINEYRIEIILMNLLFEVEDRRIQDNRSTDTADSILKRVVKEINNIILNNVEISNKIIGIGVGVPGLVDSENGEVIYSSELEWKQINIKDYIQSLFDIQVIVDDSTRAIAVEERMFGLGKNVENFLCVNVGIGIGAALVLNGEVYYGSSQSVGQLGHMPVELYGKKCECGNEGCLELYASTKAIEEEGKYAVIKKMSSQISDLVYGDYSKVDINIIYEAARNRDEIAISILDKAAEYLAMSISGLINIFAPMLVIIEGKAFRCNKIFRDMVKEKLEKRKMKYLVTNADIVIKHDKNCMGAIGAATFVLENFINCGAEVEKTLNV